MKKKIVLILFAAIVMICTIAYAEGTVYEIEEYDFTLEVPDGWLVITRDFTESMDNIEALGLDADDLETQFNDYYIYLDAVRQDPLTEIIVTVIEDSSYEDIVNFSLLAETDLENFSQVIMESYESTREYTDYTVYVTGDITYIVLDFSQESDEGDIYARQYITIVNGEMISLIIKKYEDDFTYDDVSVLRKIAESVEFSHIDKKKSGILSNLTSGNVFGILGTSTLATLGIIIILLSLLKNATNKAKKK